MRGPTNIVEAAGGGPLSRMLSSDAIQGAIMGGLPPWIDPAQFMRIAVSAFGDAAFDGISPAEKTRAVLKCAEIGLLPGAAQHIAFIPRGKKLQPEVMFRGYVYLAEQLPHVTKVTPHVVHTSDPFSAVQVGPNRWEVTEHGRADGDPFASRPFRYRKGISAKDTGLRGCYIQIDYVDGTTGYHVIPGDRVLANMAASRTDSISSKWPERFFRKTAIRAAWADGIFSSSDAAIVDRAAKLRALDMEPAPRVSAPPAFGYDPATGEITEPPADVEAIEPDAAAEDASDCAIDDVEFDSPEMTEDGILIPAGVGVAS